MSGADQLDPEIVAWIAETGGGEVTRLDRGLARREAWLVDVTRPDGTVVEMFLRIAHPGDPANSTEGLEKETQVVAALAGTAVTVPGIHGIHRDPHVVLFERLPGRTDLHTTPAEQQRAVYQHHLEILGELHKLDHASLGLDDLHVPAGAVDCAMAEVDAIAQGIAGLGAQPLARFGVEWMRRNAPPEVPRYSLVHGDAGIANFLFIDDRISAVIDWEWAHIGDPMEDLGNLNIHASFSPSGEWADLLPYYEKVSGIPLEMDKVFYYRASNLVRSVLALAPIRSRLHPRDPVALNLCFAIICDRLMCESIAEAMGIELERPEVPEPETGVVSLYDVVVENLRGDVADHVEGDFPRDRVRTSILLVETLERRHVLGPWLEATELDELEVLLGQRPADVAAGMVELDELIGKGLTGGARDEEILRYLARMAMRAEIVAAPVVSQFGNTELRPVT